MTNPTESPSSLKEGPSSRRIACSACGTVFACSPDGACWCAEETARLPMPIEGGDCLCRECLRKAAAQMPQQS
jgi:hypothetical protein